MLSAVRVASRTNTPTAAVIIVHGLGDSGSGWKFFADMARQSSDFDHIRFVFPNAPNQPVSINGGIPMPSWFDIDSFGEYTNNRDVAGYLKSLDTVKQYINEQVESGIPTERIVVGGFSQGGGLALGTAALFDKKLAGILAFSPAAPFYSTFKEKKVDVNIDTPIFHGHGTSDPVVPYEAGKLTRDFFTKELGFKNYKHESYPGLEHSCANEELAAAYKLISDVLPKQ
ncbi:CYFA0S02e00760g1_1 [Cyberlindnera fabianii]|uniref:Acyl-protein thioesterase 1 n=1 Tax=Cyberlindnera fabianii TaxID=36022 RepID=A0A061ASM1_CYBFA|nr:Acyl-protein thioesterase 1 [Cyberlindnera fabianii]CDR38362.1 CYFA0S02e00760g1_1 [Cyberlindnera fabianii]